MISLDAFLQLPCEEIARLVRESGTKVVVFPINGTRRWFMLEHGHKKWDDPVEAYLDIVGKQTIELAKLIFEHGIDTLLIPVIGREMLETRENYMEQLGARGLARVADHPDFLSFYKEYGIRVRFYGDYRKKMSSAPYAHLVASFDDVSERTKRNSRCRLFYGVFADHATETIADLAIRYHNEHGVVPDKPALVERYYGEPVKPVDIFIGFDKFAVYDYPLLGWGEEDIYFTVAPSLYMTDLQLRAILYDHLYTRKEAQAEYSMLSTQERENLRQFYRKHQQFTFGTGRMENRVWVPNFES
ncbi:MAG: diterpene synthase [Chloroflexota bacterium]